MHSSGKSERMKKSVFDLNVARSVETGRWMVDGLPDTYDDMVNLIRLQVPFTFARYGDGEWNAMTYKDGANCDGHKYFPDMGERLRDIVYSEPKYMMGIQPLTLSHYADKLRPIVDPLDIQWVNADCLHDASIDGRLSGILDAINESYHEKVIVVAPERLHAPLYANLLPSMIRFISVPLENCWTEYSRIRDELFATLDIDEGFCVLVCASMMANVLVHDAHEIYGEDNTFIDAGSVFDPHCGFKTRSYHEKLKV